MTQWIWRVNIVLFAQKNPQAIRLAEERRGLEQLTMSAAVNLSRAWQLSAHIHNMCSEAHEAIYTREADVKHWLDKGQRSSYLVLSLQLAYVLLVVWEKLPPDCLYIRYISVLMVLNTIIFLKIDFFWGFLPFFSQ